MDSNVNMNERDEYMAAAGMKTVGDVRKTSDTMLSSIYLKAPSRLPQTAAK
jgi:hypothetical protein